MILVVALLIMAVMSIIGATALTTSRIDIRISHNTKVSREAFYFSDGGVEMSPKFVREIVNDGVLPNPQNVTLNAQLLNEVMGFIPGPDPNDGVYPNLVNADIHMAVGDHQVDVDIDRTGTGMTAGSGVEFGAGAEGAGVGSVGGVLIFYNMESVGRAPANALAHLDVFYRLAVGVAGGK